MCDRVNSIVEVLTSLCWNRWDVIAPKGMNRSDANKAVMKLGLGGFHVIQMPNPKHYLLIIKTTNGCFEASLVKSAQGWVIYQI